MGSLSGVFVADPKDVAEAKGRTLWSYEDLGNHCEFEYELNEDNLKLISTDPSHIEFMEEYLNGSTGYNPIEKYIEARDDGEYDE